MCHTIAEAAVNQPLNDRHYTRPLLHVQKCPKPLLSSSEQYSDPYYSEMAVDFVLLLKLKLLLASGCVSGGESSGGQCQPYLHAALLWFFVLKLPLAAGMRGSSYADIAVSLRLFLFRLNRVLFHDGPMHGGGRRWERALRLFRGRLRQQADVEGYMISP